MTDLPSRLTDLAIQIQQIAAPTFAEGPRGEFVRGLFQQEGLKDVSMDSIGNVYARLPSSNSSMAGRLRTRKNTPLIVSAHLDTVFPEKISLQVRKEAGKIYGAGIGDNSLGVAALFGIVWSLRQQKIELKHDLWLVANVGEEGLGDLRGMRGVVERFGKDVIGYLILEGLALGHIYHRAVGVRRYRIRVQTEGGHSWSDYGRPSAVHELAALVTQLSAMRLPREPRTTMNVGTISGGTGINVLASEAICELDMRSEDPSVLAKVVAQAEDLIHAVNCEEVKVTAEVIGQRPAGEIPVDHPLVQLGTKCISEQGVTPVLTSGSTDANAPLSKGIPAVVLGITTGGGAHTTHEYIDVEPVGKGMESVVMFVGEVVNSNQ
ncbi:MAG: M20/M25/M40 family metallo-hydrolase [Chloroflexi bacterium]|nr:M20/M25/M40 family metallo-hydrolase [Chloroflexota bacterium]